MADESAPLTFQDKVALFFRDGIVKACKEIPELRSVAVIFDWKNELNEGALPFLWGNERESITADQVQAIVGMMEQTQKFVQAQAKVMLQTIALCQHTVEQLHEKAEAAQPRGPSAPLSVPGIPEPPPGPFRQLRHPLEAYSSPAAAKAFEGPDAGGHSAGPSH
jgi:hypothetical protein